MSQPQYSLIQDNTSTEPASAMASALSVLTATFWIFLECHTIGFTTLCLLFWIFSSHAMIIIPWCESGSFWEANEASEKAMNLTLSISMGWTLMVTLAWAFASCKALLASIKVSTLAEFILDWSHPNRLHMSGRLFTAAYWRDPTKALSACLSSSVTGASGTPFLSPLRPMGWISFTYCFLAYWNAEIFGLINLQTSKCKVLLLVATKGEISP